jgi:hypothetical protein
MRQLPAGTGRGPEPRAGGTVAGIATLPETVPAVCALACLILGGFVVRRVLSMPGPGQGFVDAYIYMNAASTLVHHPAALYQPAIQGMAGSAYIASESPNYLYPPSGVIPFLPLVPLVQAAGKPLAASLWLVVDVAAAVAAVGLLARHLGLSRLAGALCLLLVAASAPMLSEIDADNVTGVLLLLLAGAWIDMDARRERAGVWLGLAMALKPVVPLLLLVPLVRGRWRTFAVACGVGAVLNAALVPVLGWTTTWSYLSQVLPWSAGWLGPRPANLSLANLLRVFVGGGAFSNTGVALSPLHLATLAAALGVAVRLGAVVLVLVAARRVATPGLALGLAAAPVALLSGTVWAHYYLLVVPLLLWALATAPGRTRVALYLATAVLAIDLHPGGLFTPDVTVNGSPLYWTWLVHALLFDVAAMVTVAVALVLAAFGRVGRAAPGAAPPVTSPEGRGALPAVPTPSPA